MKLNPKGSLLLPAKVFIVVASCALLTHFEISRSKIRGTCSDFTFPIPHANDDANPLWNASIHPLNPTTPYTDFVTLTFHNDRNLIGLNNANCQLKISGVRGMSREALQCLKPLVLREAVRRTRSRHLAYFDWDANWIRWPPRPPSGLVVQGTPPMSRVNTGAFAFFNARAHLPLLQRWASFETPGKHDQGSWHVMEREAARHGTPLARTLAMDGVMAEHYNWNCVDKRRTVVRCRRLISFVEYLVPVANAAIALALAVVLFSALRPRDAGPRAGLALVLLVAVAISVLFRGDYQQQNAVVSPYESERLCVIPESALRRDGSIVTRRGVTTGQNLFLASMIRSVGLQHTATVLTLWFVVLERMRFFARIFVVLEILSLLSLFVTGPRHRPESLVWVSCTYLLDIRQNPLIGSSWWLDRQQFSWMYNDRK